MIAELDVNPVIVSPSACVAVDALVVPVTPDASDVTSGPCPGSSSRDPLAYKLWPWV